MPEAPPSQNPLISLQIGGPVNIQRQPLGFVGERAQPGRFRLANMPLETAAAIFVFDRAGGPDEQGVGAISRLVRGDHN